MSRQLVGPEGPLTPTSSRLTCGRQHCVTIGGGTDLMVTVLYSYTTIQSLHCSTDRLLYGPRPVAVARPTPGMMMNEDRQSGRCGPLSIWLVEQDQSTSLE